MTIELKERLINNFRIFRSEYWDLTNCIQEANGEIDVKKDYPFSESFDELKISKWVISQIEIIENLEVTK